MFAYVVFWVITSFGLIGCFQLHWAAGLVYLTPYLIAHGLCVGAFKPETSRPTPRFRWRRFFPRVARAWKDGFGNEELPPPLAGKIIDLRPVFRAMRQPTARS